MSEEDIRAAEEYATKETADYCKLVDIKEYDDFGYRTDFADAIFQRFYKRYLVPETVDYTVGNVGGIAIKTVNSKGK